MAARDAYPKKFGTLIVGAIGERTRLFGEDEIVAEKVREQAEALRGSRSTRLRASISYSRDSDRMIVIGVETPHPGRS
jgi:hypothetical protein